MKILLLLPLLASTASATNLTVSDYIIDVINKHGQYKTIRIKETKNGKKGLVPNKAFWSKRSISHLKDRVVNEFGLEDYKPETNDIVEVKAEYFKSRNKEHQYAIHYIYKKDEMKVCSLKYHLFTNDTNFRSSTLYITLIGCFDLTTP